MQPKRDDWEKPRARNHWLTEHEIARLRHAYDLGFKPTDAAREIQCSSRIAYKYFAVFRGKPLAQRQGKKHLLLQRKMAEQPSPPAAPKSRFHKGNFEI
jgi:hypothetical protein